MQNATQSGRDAEYRVISARVPSELPDRVEELTEDNLSEEIRAGLRARIAELEQSEPATEGSR